MSQQNQDNQLVRRHYDRIAPFYDWMEWFAEFRFSGKEQVYCHEDSISA